MTPFWQDEHLTLYGGDCRVVLASMAPESVHCVVTSPPYWGLRDYGTATWEGGDAACDHRSPTMRDGRNEDRAKLAGSEATNAAQLLLAHRTGCGKCGASKVDSQLGLEPTPEEYVANMVAVFREVRRVLRPDGTLWLNLGDSYSQGGYAGDDAPSNAARIASGGADGKFNGAGREATRQGHRKPMQRNAAATGLKPKDLVGIPWRVAFALQADGWYLRSDIIWSKPNPMPESVTDRPTKAHEYLFLLSKQPRYYFDADAVREDGAGRTDVGRMTSPARLNQGGPWTATEKAEAGRNLRSVWTIATEPYPGAHFATFPRKLVEPCVKAGTSERGVCPECGAPWVRETTVSYSHHSNTKPRHPDSLVARTPGSDKSGAVLLKNVETIGWRPSCPHGDPEADWSGDWITDVDFPRPAPVPAVVLDPFAGSGTTLLVAQSLGRRGVGIDLSPEYLEQALTRNSQAPLGLLG